MTKKVAFYSFVMFAITLFFSGCSSNDDDGTISKGSASAVVSGTYRGAYDSKEFDKLLFIEDLGNNKIRMSGNDRTPIEMEVQFVSEYTEDKDVMHKSGELAGVFIYTAGNKSLKFSGRRIQEDQKLIFFSGKKE
ncbi:hypothetical protein [Empedobacter tilapiae]|nr:hypothetical protein [Empedobacter tilapiae]